LLFLISRSKGPLFCCIFLFIPSGSLEGINENYIIKNREGLFVAEQSRAEQSRAEQSRAEQSRAEQSRAEQRVDSATTSTYLNTRKNKLA
jgi:hypothetical protein